MIPDENISCSGCYQTNSELKKCLIPDYLNNFLTSGKCMPNLFALRIKDDKHDRKHKLMGVVNLTKSGAEMSKMANGNLK